MEVIQTQVHTIPDDAPVNPVPYTEVLQKKKQITRTYQVVWYLLGVIEVLLAFRFILKLFGANPLSPFAAFIYGTSSLFTFPFSGLFPTPATGLVALDISTLFAMIVYFVIAMAIVKVLQLTKPLTKEEVVKKVDNPVVRL